MAVWRDKKPELLCGFLCLLTVGSLATILVRQHLYVVSANAVVGAYSAPLPAEVDGEILRVLVEEHQQVKRGQLLAVQDDRAYRAKLLAAEAALGSAQARLDEAQLDETRYAWLARRRSAPAVAFEHARAKRIALEGNVSALRAAAEKAALEVRKTHITAAEDGVIAFRRAQPGTFVKAGTPLFGFVRDRERWVMAKVKETDLPYVQVGDSVRLTFEADSRRRVEGKVESLAPATEVPFGTAVADPSVGNFTKFVQWHPIRIAMSLSPEDRARIPVGSSVEVRMARKR